MAPPAAGVPHKVFTCYDCEPNKNKDKAQFPPIFATEEEFLDHRMAMIKTKQGPGHLNCHECKTPLHTLKGYTQHIQTVHNKKQDLVCPGCKKTFSRVGGLMGHIETGKCVGISNDRINAAREEKASGLRGGLIAMEDKQRSGLGKSVITNNSSVGSLESMRPEDSPQAMKGHQLNLSSDLPPSSIKKYLHGDSKQPDLLTEDTVKAIGPLTENPWTRKPVTPLLQPSKSVSHAVQEVKGQPKVTSVIPGPARPLGVQQTRQLRPIQTKKSQVPMVDQFNVRQFYDPIIQMYTCPHSRCGKTMRSPTGLLLHLKSPLHSKEQMLCPSCLNYFPGVTALTQHVESQGSRCRVRDSDQYRTFVDQLTAGLSDVDGRHTDQTVRYVVPETDEAFRNKTDVTRNAQVASRNFTENLHRQQRPPRW